MNNGSQQDVPPYVAQGAPKVNFNVGSGNNGNCTANGPSPTLNGKSIDRAETIWESEARNSQ